MGTVTNGRDPRWSSNVPSVTIMRPSIQSGSCPDPSSNVGASSSSAGACLQGLPLSRFGST
jgi:hypothetical protein